MMLAKMLKNGKKSNPAYSGDKLEGLIHFRWKYTLFAGQDNRNADHFHLGVTDGSTLDVDIL
jgi:hypothetical protein